MVSVKVFRHFLQFNTSDSADYDFNYNKPDIAYLGVAYGKIDIIIDFNPDDAPDSVPYYL